MAARVGVKFLGRWIREFANQVAVNLELLTDLDAAIGDADHGVNMNRGMTAVLAALDEASPKSPADLLRKVGITLVGTVGGASGPLFGTFFLRMGAAAADHPEGLDTAAFAKALRSGIDGVAQRGKAVAGDKTMVDALVPAAEALDEAVDAGATLLEAFDRAAGAARAGRDATLDMRAHKGRASYLGSRSIGHKDPGATSAAMLIAALTIPARTVAV